MPIADDVAGVSSAGSVKKSMRIFPADGRGGGAEAGAGAVTAAAAARWGAAATAGGGDDSDVMVESRGWGGEGGEGDHPRTRRRLGGAGGVERPAVAKAGVGRGWWVGGRVGWWVGGWVGG